MTTPQSDLKTIFPTSDPSRIVDLLEGRKVRLLPIKIREVPALVSTLLRIGDLTKQGVNTTELLETMAPEIIGLIESHVTGCGDDHVNGGDLGIGDLPFLIDALIEINFNKDILGKWQALAAKLPGRQAEPSAAVTE